MTSKKVSIISAAALIIALIAGIFIWNAGADNRMMKKALESGSVESVLQVYRKLSAKGEAATAREAIIDFINQAGEKINKDFTFDISPYTDEESLTNAVDRAMEDYTNQHWGPILSSGDLYELDDPMVENALEEFDTTVHSKLCYYAGTYQVSHAESYGDYKNAIETLEQVAESDQNYEDAVQKAEEAYDGYMNAMIKLADDYIAKEDYSAAIELLNTATESEFAKKSDELSKKLAEVKQSSAQKYAEKAKACLLEGDAEGAVGNMEVAANILPSDENKAKLEEYKLYLPLKLYDKNNILIEDNNCNVITFENSTVANDNTEFKNILFADVGWGIKGLSLIASHTYNLTGKYDNVTGTIFIPRGYKSIDSTGYLEAYGDGKLIYTSPKVTGGVLPQKINFSITGVQTLEIKYFGSENGDIPRFAVSELIAQKALPSQQ